jgi:hypothetical protein
MASRALLFSGVLRTAALAAKDINGLCDRLKMAGIYTSPVSTFMIQF